MDRKRIHGEVQSDLQNAKDLLDEAYEMTIVGENEEPDWGEIANKVNRMLDHTDRVGTLIENITKGIITWQL